MSISSRRMGEQIICPRCHEQNLVPDEEGAAQTLAARKAHKKKLAAQAAAATELAAPSAGSATPPPLAPHDSTADAYATDDDTELVYEDELHGGAIAEEDFDIHKVAISRRTIYVQGALLILVALGAFFLGMFVGGGPKERSKAVIRDLPCKLSGSVTCRERREKPEVPDRGAVVLLLPEVVPTGARLASGGLRPSDPSPPADHAGLRTLRDWGGAYARTDNKGGFSLTLQHPGNYRVLIISALSRREAGEEPKKEELDKLAEIVSEPQELLRDSRYLWTTIVLNEDSQKTFAVP